jgi:dolichyl-phosphate beta-glucosyltransferase
LVLVPRLSLVVPAFNEQARLPALMDAAQAFAAGFTALELLVVDDGSTDGTLKVARSFVGRAQPPLRVQVLGHFPNRGKGAAVRAGMLAAAEPWILMADADLSTPLEDLATLAAAGTPVAMGSRAAPGARITRRQPLYRETMGKIFNKLIGIAGVTGFGDTQCGFKLFQREVAREIFSRVRIDRFAFDVEVIYLARKLGHRVAEVPVRWKHHAPSKVHALRDSSRMLVDLLRIRLMHR